MTAAQNLSRRLADGEVVVIDGGTGTQLQAEGAPMDDETWSARASLEHPELVQAVHEAYIRAGAEVIIANSFATSRPALEPAGLGASSSWVSHGAQIIGGCCGVGPEHIRVLADRLARG